MTYVIRQIVLGRFKSNFQDMFSSPSFITDVSGFYIIDLRSNMGHDLVILNLWDNFEVLSVLKILQIPASLYYVWS